MLRPILVLKLPEFARTKLQALGFEYVEDLEKVLDSSDDLPAQVRTVIDEFKIIEKIKSGNSPFEIVSGASLWHSEFCTPPIAVFHKGLDKLLGGGLPVGRITELCGPPGSGKTQMSMQFCVDVQIPPHLGGSGGEAFYISTDFGFRVERLSEIMQASVQHCHNIEYSRGVEREKVLKDFNLNKLLGGVNVLQIYQLNDLMSAVKNLKDFLTVNNKVKLLVIDSFSLPLVTEVEDLIMRSKITAEMLDVLLDNAIKYKLAVVLTNQLSTVVTQNNKAVLKPSLGEGFGHRLHKRLLLDSGKIFLMKSINRSQMYTCFEITKDGIR